MAFSLLPAIDCTRGSLGVFTADGPTPVAAFGGDPLAAAAAFVEAGARWVHVVDMDLAFEGVLTNAGVIEQVRHAHPGLRVQASGGIRTPRDADALLEAGADRVVLSSGILGDPDATADLLRRLGDRALAGIEMDDGRIRSRGRDPVDLDLMSTLGWLVGLGVPGLVLTAVERVGGLGGPDVASVRRVARSGRPVLAAGGISTLDDLVAVRGAGGVGAIVGRAALEGMDLAGAFAWAGA